MPEIKNTFSQGRMNKDLDERLIPNGQYRHALNIDVTAVEDSDAGVVKNIRGNEQISNLLPDTFVCVGSIKDERNNKFYWFVHNNDENIDAILEYNQLSKTSQFIAVDLSGNESYENITSFLNFTGKQITGINIVDNFLFWSDGDNEPKKINISKSSQQNPLLQIQDQEHAYLFVNGEITDTLLQEEHVTVIKKKPTSAPTVKLISAKGEAGKAIFEKVFLRFCLRYKYSDGEYSAFSPFTDVVFNPEYDDLINSSNAFTTDEPYNKAMINLIKSIELYDFIAPDMPKDVVQVDILYKQEDSPVIYSVENISIPSNEAAEDGSGQFNTENNESKYKGKYVIDSENIHAALPENQFLRAFDAVPKSALGQEVIGNRLVYANYKQGYNFENTKPTINANYNLRLSQDFSQGGLKSLKSQRNYQLGYVLGDKYGRETPVFTTRGGGVNIDWSSTDYGLNASNSTMFTVQLNAFEGFPSWADYYKFYVKLPSDEYYNLVMDKSYFPFTHNDFENKDDHLYISFASSDRNKLVEDDYIIAKKIYDNSNQQVFPENKYKILDISNEAPDAVKYVFDSLGSVQNNASNILCSSSNDFDQDSLFPGPTSPSAFKRIDQQTDIIHIQKTAWLSSNIDGAPLIEDADGNYDKDVYISWQVSDIHSDRYKVTSIRISGGSQNVYVLKLSSPITETDAKLAAFNDTITTTEFKLDLGLTFKCERRQLRNEEDFSGKFFVKIKHNDHLSSSISDPGFHVVEEAGCHWLYGEFNTTDLNPSEGIVNSTTETFNTSGAAAASSIDGVDGFATTASEWQAIKTHIGNKFFIDDMNFIAGNPSTSSYAKESGDAIVGGRTTYPPIDWIDVDQTEAPGSGPMRQSGRYWLHEANYGGADFSDDPNATDHIGQIEVGYGKKGPYGFAPLPREYGGDDGQRQVNSFEGILNTNASHGSSANPNLTPRRFRSSSIYDLPNSINLDNTYSDTSGKHFIHLSFLAPGVDLIDGLSASDLIGTTLVGKDSIASKLQGIWGGGAFTKTPPNHPFSGDTGVDGSDITPVFGGLSVNQGSRVVEFEGNYATEAGQNPNPNGSLVEAPGPGVGQGYDTNFTARHIQQWNPAFSTAGINQDIDSFLLRLKTPGQKFKFKGDNTQTVYTILKVTEKHVYNHTSWRMKWILDPPATPSTPGTYVAGQNSVEEAASKWADFITSSDLIPSNSNDPNYEEAATELADTINNFGAAHNRRTTFIIELDKDPADGNYDPRVDENDIDATDFTKIEFISELVPSQIDSLFVAPTVWETEPLQLADLNIYHEASNNIPIRLTETNNELFAPVGSEVKFVDLGVLVSNVNIEENIYINKWVNANSFETTSNLPEGNYETSVVQLCKSDGSYIQVRIDSSEGNVLTINEDISPTLGLNYFNCFCFGDGIESDRIRDGFNKMQISSGARVSATIEEPFIEEHRTNGLIYSGIYNSNSSTNNLNQFIAAEKITKDLNPTYGSIQKLYTRSTDLVALCEDRIIKILANKDAVLNADGNPQLVATEKVLGQAIPFVGDYGISTHPESFAAETYRAYFTDKQRGAVLRLSMDGLTPISDAGMRDYFRDNLVDEANFIGSYDAYNKQYNLTIKKMPIIGSILEDDFSEGAETISDISPNQIEYITDENINNGTSYTGEVLVQDLPELEERTLTQNSELEGNVTIINHPAIDVLVPAEEIINYTTISIEDVDENDIDNPYWDTFYNDTSSTVTDQFESFPQGQAPEIFGFSAVGGDMDQEVEHPFEDVGNGGTKFNIKRANNLTHDSADGPAVIQEYNGYNGDDTNLGFGFGEEGGGISGNANVTKWQAPVAVFQQNQDGFVAGQVPGTLQGNGEDEWPTINTGITFRGSPAGADGAIKPFGFIQFPKDGFILGGTNQVPNDVLETVPSAKNNTIFKGEEIEVELRYRSNHVGTDHDNLIIVRLYDGNSAVSSSLITGGGTNSNEDIDSWTSDNYLSTGPIGAQYNSDGVKKIYFKFDSTPETEGDIAVQDLQIRLTVYSYGDVGSSKIYRLSETVIRSCKVKKIYRLTSQDYQTGGIEIDSDNEGTTISVPNPTGVFTDPVPLEPIPAWAEVIYPDAIEGFITEGANIDQGLEEQFGLENPGELIPYEDADGNQLTYLSGSSNGVTEYSSLQEQMLVPINHVIEAEDFTAVLDPNKPLQADKWYLVEVKVTDDFALTIPTFIEFLGIVDNFTVPFTVFTDDFTKTQIGEDVVDEGKKLRLTPTDNVYRGLFKLSDSDSPVSDISKMRVSFAGFGEGNFVESVKLINIDLSDNSYYGGDADDYDINPVLYQIQRASAHALDNVPGYSSPIVWYENSRINLIGTPLTFENLECKFSQELPSDLSASADGYELKIELDPSGLEYTPDLDSTLAATITGLSASSPTGFQLSANNDENIFNLNFAEELTEPPVISIVGVNAQATIAKISLKDITNYFIPGNIGAWSTTGFDPIVDDFIVWTSEPSGNAQFNNAESNHLLFHNIELTVGHTFELTFDHDIDAGLLVEYRNSSGFIDEAISVSQSGTTSMQFTVTDNASNAGDLPNCIVFRAASVLTGTIDNIILKRVITDEEFGADIQTISYSEDSKGWTSFKSYIPDNGVSLSNQYFTFKHGQPYQHYVNDTRNRFYGVQYPSSVTAILNAQPSSVKNFKTLNYEGSQARILSQDDSAAIDIYNADGFIQGWYAESIVTDISSGSVLEFVEKENKWFNYIKGIPGLVDTGDFNVQGLGTVSHTTEE